MQALGTGSPRAGKKFLLLVPGLGLVLFLSWQWGLVAYLQQHPEPRRWLPLVVC